MYALSLLEWLGTFLRWLQRLASRYRDDNTQAGFVLRVQRQYAAVKLGDPAAFGQTHAGDESNDINLNHGKNSKPAWLLNR